MSSARLVSVLTAGPVRTALPLSAPLDATYREAPALLLVSVIVPVDTPVSSATRESALPSCALMASLTWRTVSAIVTKGGLGSIALVRFARLSATNTVHVYRPEIALVLKAGKGFGAMSPCVLAVAH